MDKPDKVVVRDPDAPCLPLGCITSTALESLALAMDRLRYKHNSLGGAPGDLPCLRRIESADGAIVAHISIGPAVGGHWERLTYNRNANSWKLGL